MADIKTVYRFVFFLSTILYTILGITALWFQYEKWIFILR